MKRRDIFGLVVGGASTMLSVCLAKHGRASGRKARIGVLLPVPGNEQFIPALQEGLRDAGLDVDRDVELEIHDLTSIVDFGGGCDGPGHDRFDEIERGKEAPAYATRDGFATRQ
jgi:hypothetical protein